MGSLNSLWLDVDKTLRALDQVYGQAIKQLEISVIEWYILRALYEKDGQRPSDLADAVGQLRTSFTPLLNKLQNKNLIERRENVLDHRSVQIYLTEAGKALSKPTVKITEQVETQIQAAIPQADWTSFISLLAALQVPKHDPK